MQVTTQTFTIKEAPKKESWAEEFKRKMQEVRDTAKPVTRLNSRPV